VASRTGIWNKAQERTPAPRLCATGCGPSTSSTAPPAGCPAPAGSCSSPTARGGRQRRVGRQRLERPGL